MLTLIAAYAALFDALAIFELIIRSTFRGHALAVLACTGFPAFGIGTFIVMTAAVIEGIVLADFSIGMLAGFTFQTYSFAFAFLEFKVLGALRGYTLAVRACTGFPALEICTFIAMAAAILIGIVLTAAFMCMLAGLAF
jgi:hypothetical protein